MAQDRKNVFVKFEASESIENKKTLLEASASVIEALMAVRRFKGIRKEELKFNSEAKRNINIINSLLSRIEQELPQLEELPKTKTKEKFYRKEETKQEKTEKKQAREKKKPVEKKVEEEKKPKLEQELEEIRAKLSKL